MTRSEIKKVQKELEAVLSKYGVITGNSARFGSNRSKFSIEISHIDEKNAPKMPIATTVIKQGNAPAGTRINISGQNDDYTILKKRRTKYLVSDSNDRQYTVSFGMCSAAGVPA